MIFSTRPSIRQTVFALLPLVGSLAWANPAPDAHVTCAAILSQVQSSGQASLYMVNLARGILDKEIEQEEKKSSRNYPQVTMGVSERAFSLDVDQTSRPERKSIAQARWEQVAQNLGALKPGNVAFAQVIEGHEEISLFLNSLDQSVEELSSRVEPILAQQKFWDPYRKILVTLRSIIPAGSLGIAGWGGSITTGLDLTESNNLFGIAMLAISSFGAKDTVEVLPWWFATVSKRTQRWLDQRSGYRALHFTEGLDKMAQAINLGSPTWRSIHISTPVSEALAQTIIENSDPLPEDQTDHLAVRTLDSALNHRRMQLSNMRWAGIDIFLSIEPNQKPILVIAGSLQKNFFIAPKKRKKPRSESAYKQEGERGLVPELIPIRNFTK